MRKAEVFDYFGGAVKTARKLGLTRSAVHQWDEDMIPERSALLAYEASNGDLPFDKAAYAEKRKNRLAKHEAA